MIRRRPLTARRHTRPHGEQPGTHRTPTTRPMSRHRVNVTSRARAVTKDGARRINDRTGSKRKPRSPVRSLLCPKGDAMRGGTSARGYGTAHQKLRAQWQRTIDAHGARCAAQVCLESSRVIPHGTTAWDLGHTADRSAYSGPEHRRCNRSDGGKRSGRHRRSTLVTSRRW